MTTEDGDDLAGYRNELIRIRRRHAMLNTIGLCHQRKFEIYPFRETYRPSECNIARTSVICLLFIKLFLFCQIL